jgi:Fe-S oxidoreductase
MYKLKFEEEICAVCETNDCLTKCRYLDLDLDQAKREVGKLIRGEDSMVLHECVTCYACEEYCPYGNHPFYRIVELQESRDIYPAPKPITNQQIKSMSPVGKGKVEELQDPVISLCAFPEAKRALRSNLFHNPDTFFGRDYFCNLMYLHFAKSSIIKERLPGIIENIWEHKLRESDKKELVCYHDECYATYTAWAPAYGVEVPFKPIYFYEYLYNRIKANIENIKPITAKVAYQRPCSNRLIPEHQHWVDDIFELIGVDRVARKYDREDALCCGSVLRMQGRDDLAHDLQVKNLEDMESAEVEYCVFNCPFCSYTLSEMIKERKIKPIMMIDLCRLAFNDSVKKRR